MLAKLSIFLIGFYLALASAELVRVSDIARGSDVTFMQFLVQSRQLTQDNPQRSMGCFDYYVPALNGITADYEENYGACISKADTAKSDVDDTTSVERAEIESCAKSSCELLSACNKHANSVDYFDCYANGGSANSKTMYTISANASEILADMREKYRLIENEEQRCQSTAERNYVEGTTATYEELQSCLQGKTPIPTTTSTQAPTTTSTEAPVSSTTAAAEVTTAASTEAVTETTIKVITDETTTDSGIIVGSTTAAVTEPEPTTTASSIIETTTEAETTTVIFRPSPPVTDSNESESIESETKEDKSESKSKEDKSESKSKEDNSESKDDNSKSEKDDSESKEDNSKSKEDNSESSGSNESNDSEETATKLDKYDNIKNIWQEWRKKWSRQ